jgi:hypothetical protein
MSKSVKFVSRPIWCADSLRFRKVLNAAKVRNARRQLTELNEPSKPNDAASLEVVEALRFMDQ